MKKSSLFLCLLVGSMLMSACGQEQKPETENKKEPTKEKTAESTHVKKQTGYAKVNDLNMYYEIHGQGKPIILLHGSFMTIPSNWGKMIPALATNRQVIAVEMQGHGRTADIDREFSYENLADDISELMKYLKIDSADILGYSLGAGVALQMGLRHPEQVRKLVIMSGVYQYKGWHAEARAMFPHMTPEMFKGSPMQKQYDSLAPDTAHWTIFAKKLIALDNKDFDWKASNIKKMKAPVFILMGDSDGVSLEHAIEMFKLKGGGKMGDLSGLIDSRLAVLPATSHLGMLERINWMVPMINEFLDAAPQPAHPMTH